MQLKAEPNKNTFHWIYIAKGIGIILVVVAHFCPESSPPYWIEIKLVIYSFIMALFFILSGYLYIYAKYSYSDLIRRKATRLLYPYIVVAAIWCIIKYIVGQFIFLANPVCIDSVYALLIDPINSFKPALWFVHALFLIFCVYPLLRLFLNNLTILMLLVGIISIIGFDYLVFGKAFGHMPFFVLGVMLRENVKLSKRTINSNWRYVTAPLLIFLVIYMIKLSVNFEDVYGYLLRFSLGVVGSLFIINISHAISSMTWVKIDQVFAKTGLYSMSIYLFHTLFESTIRIGFLEEFKYIPITFELIALIAILSGVLFPLLLEKKVLRKHKFTRRFVLGLD